MWIGLVVTALMVNQKVFGQADTPITGMDEVETLFNKDEESSETSTKPTPPPASSSEALKGEAAEKSGDGKVDVKTTEIKDVSGLGKLQSFKDIAVIQKRFLPKTNRWEFNLGPSLNLNDSFFINFGGGARLGYYFQERYGIEGIVTILTVTERQVTKDLAARGVKTTSFITPRAYYGLDFKWAPMYGKQTRANKKITPFDLYFSFGAGLTGTNQGDSAATLHLGSGQIFANSKSSAFRWDFSLYMFTAKSNVDQSGSTSLFYNLLMTLGWSWFFPEATYR